MSRWPAYITAVVFLGFLLGINNTTVYAPNNERYTLTPNPSRVQETDTVGVRLTLAVDSSDSLTSYSFNWTVTTPNGATPTARNGTFTNSGENSFTLSVVYPRDFSAGNTIKFVGNYTVVVDQFLPVFKANVATGIFTVGLTDSPEYQRTFPVSIRAAKYRSAENVTVNILNAGLPLAGFPTWTLADSAGDVSYVWQSAASTPLGYLTVALQGSQTTKNPPDSQLIRMLPTEIAIPQLAIIQSTIQRTEMAEFRFDATYASGVTVLSGSTVIRITEPDGLTSHTSTATYNSTLAQFQAKFRPSLSVQVGAWVGTIEPNSFDDGYGNFGPDKAVVRGFTVQPAALAISVIITNQTHTSGDLLAVYATVSSPDGSSYTQGTVIATLSLGDLEIGQIVLRYDQAQARWFGSYQVTDQNPSGAWLVEVEALDINGNFGSGTGSAIVNVPAQPSLLSYWYLIVLGSLGASLSGAFLFWRRHRIFRRALKIDVVGMEEEAEKVKSQPFFQSLREQLQRKKKRPGGPDE